MNSTKRKKETTNISVRVTAKEREMVDKIKDEEGFRNDADVFRFLLRHRYSLKYECLGEKNV